MDSMTDLCFLAWIFNLKNPLGDNFSQAVKAKMFFLGHPGNLYYIGTVDIEATIYAIKSLDLFYLVLFQYVVVVFWIQDD